MRYNVHEGTWNAAKNAMLKLKNKSVLIVDEMPVSPSEGTTVLYTGDNGTYTNGGIYRFQDNMWVLINATSGTTLYADTPIGTIQAYGGATAPAGWLLCKGQLVSRETYADLFAVIGDNFGVGNGSTTFNLPDLRESVPKGAGLTGKTVGAHLNADGLAVGEFLDDRVQEHLHDNPNGNDTGSTYNKYTYAMANKKGFTGNFQNGVNSGRRGATTEVKSVGVNYIIKATQSVLPYDVVSMIKNTLAGPVDNTKFAPTVSTNIVAQHNGIAYFVMTSISAMSVKKDNTAYFPNIDGAGTMLCLSGTVFIEKGHTYNFFKYNVGSGSFLVNFIPFD